MAAFLRPLVALQTRYGTIECEIFADRAPVTAAYFLDGVAQRLLDAATIFRIVGDQNEPGASAPIAVVQFGLRTDDPDIAPTILHETTAMTGLRHRRGTLSMARFAPGAVYHSAFLCVSDCPALDFGATRHPDGLGFAAFGQITSGLDVLDQLHNFAETQDYLRRPIPLDRIEIIRR